MTSEKSLIRKLRHHLRARPRLLIAMLVGIAALIILPSGYKASTRALIAWIVGAGLYLTLAWTMIWRSSIDHMKWRARAQDDGARAILLLTVAAAIASLAAIAMELGNLKSLPQSQQVLHVTLVAVTFAASWLLVHTAFALHYAHDYYLAIAKDHRAPLEFLRQDTPIYTDFLYFSLVIGMTSQTADVVIAATHLRRWVMAHGILAFVFNTTLLALTINIVAGLLS